MARIYTIAIQCSFILVLLYNAVQSQDSKVVADQRVIGLYIFVYLMCFTFKMYMDYVVVKLPSLFIN